MLVWILGPNRREELGLGHTAPGGVRRGAAITDDSKRLSVSGLVLVAHLNDELRRFESSKSLRCNCRVVNVSTGPGSSGSAWQIDWLGGRYGTHCLRLVERIIAAQALETASD
jgi:hypothetical protein